MTGRVFKSVWDAIEATPSEAAAMRARAELMMVIRKEVGEWKESQARSAKRLGVTQPRLNDLLRGRIDKFSLDALVDLASATGLDVRVEVSRRAAA